MLRCGIAEVLRVGTQVVCPVRLASMPRPVVQWGNDLSLENCTRWINPPPSECLGRTAPKRRSVRTQLFYGTRFGSNLRRKAANPSKPKPRRETVELESGLRTAVGKLEIWTEPAIRNAENVASWKHESDFVPTPVVRNTRSTVSTSCVPMLVQIVTH